MSSYKIGLLQGNLIDLIDDPFQEGPESEISGFTLGGSPINVAMETIKWKWTGMSQAGWYQIYFFWTTNLEDVGPVPYTYIQTLAPTGLDFSYGIYRCKMGKPTSNVPYSIAEIRDATVTFYQCERVA